MKLAVIGSRNFNNYELLKSKLDIIHKNIGIENIISGGAIGADSLGKRWAEENNIKPIIFLPEWNLYGKKAGFLRNITIIENCDQVIAFWNGISKGTKSGIDLAKKYNKPLVIILVK